ncbi:MAG: hypothetical protein VYE68_01745 [Acidobacteriota bacterium]|nr:hypothetical protein [Acidobacteriota bacterium]
MGIMGVAEIVLSVGDLRKMRRFYREMPGFRFLSEACHERGMKPEAGGELTIKRWTRRSGATGIRSS